MRGSPMGGSITPLSCLPGLSADPALVEQLMSLLGQRFQNRHEWCSRDAECWQIYEIAKQDPEAAGVALVMLTGRDHQLVGNVFESRHS